MDRRNFLTTTGTAAFAAVLPRFPSPALRADHTLRIAPLKLELAPGKVVRTITYNGTVPGPLLRLKQGTAVTIDVVNDTDSAEFVHWHGLDIPPDVDGTMEEGAPPIPAHGRRSYTYTPEQSGTRWYHTHVATGKNFDRGAYTGLFGFLMVDAPNEAGRFDQEVFLALHDWDAYITGGDDGFEMVGYKYASINGRLLGFGDPVRVREGERVLMHLLNASASEAHWVALPGHRFTVQALDGNVVPNPRSVELLRLDPGERVDAIVEMNSPGVWILGDPSDAVRKKGLGVVIEYAGRDGPPEWKAPTEGARWDYRVFGRDTTASGAAPEDIERIPLVFRSVFKGHGDFEHWSINDKQYPRIEPLQITRGKRYRLAFDNQTTEDHPVHLHRHSFELTKFVGSPTTGVIKDVVTVPARGVVEVDFTSREAGKSLFHCHLQEHMDSGFMMLFESR